MDGIHKLPFLLGGFMAVISGIVSYAYDSGSQATYIRMAVALVVFYIIGTYLKNTLSNLHEEVKRKKEQELQEMLEQEALQAAREAESGPDSPEGHKVNLVADDFSDEFLPLTISRIIKKE